MCTTLYYFSSCWSDAHWSFHITPLKWREELRCAAKQTIHCYHPYGHSCFYRWVKSNGVCVNSLKVEFYCTGTHADLLITVFHKIITTGHQRLQPLFDCLLTILVNGTDILKLALNGFNIFVISFSVPKDVVHGCQHQAAAPFGGIQHPLVLVFCPNESPPGFLPIGNIQQHHPVPVRW